MKVLAELCYKKWVVVEVDEPDEDRKNSGGIEYREPGWNAIQVVAIQVERAAKDAPLEWEWCSYYKEAKPGTPDFEAEHGLERDGVKFQSYGWFDI